MLPVPRRWSDVDPPWMTAALSGRHPDVVVAEVRLGPVDGGTNARARAAIGYERGEGPTSVFVKREGGLLSRLALVALGALATEARLAASGVDLPLEHPRPYTGAVCPRRLATVVVMEDVAAGGGLPHDAVTALSVDAVSSGLEGLARLHATFPASAMPPPLRFLRPWHLGPGWAAVSVASLGRGIRRLSSLGSGSLLPAPNDARLLGAGFALSARLASAGPQCMLHGDPHPGNTYAAPDGRTGFLDWQLARTGHWSHDVGYFLAGSLAVEDRRSHERALLAGYLEAHAKYGGTPPSWDEAWSRYRATPAFGLGTWIHTLSFGRFQSEAACLATIARFAAAYEDLDTARRIVEQ